MPVAGGVLIYSNNGELVGAVGSSGDLSDKVPPALHHNSLRACTHISAGVNLTVVQDEACLLAGKQPLESAFRSYSSWLPHACHDMRYEQMATGGAADPFAVRKSTRSASGGASRHTIK